MPADMAALTADLAAESAELYEVLSLLAEPEWARESPAAGWTLRDQVAHLAFFDDAAVLSATDPRGNTTQFGGSKLFENKCFSLASANREAVPAAHRQTAGATAIDCSTRFVQRLVGGDDCPCR